MRLGVANLRGNKLRAKSRVGADEKGPESLEIFYCSAVGNPSIASRRFLSTQ